MKKIELKKLAGLHILSGVETGYVKEKSEYDSDYEDCNYISFILDGKKYTALEDPSDGYRSCMRHLKVGKGTLKNTFPDTQVFVSIGCGGGCFYSDKCREIAFFCAVDTGKIVLEVGTYDTNDYYPSFAACFRPENLPVNKGVRSNQ